jgi:hypothetical protein
VNNHQQPAAVIRSRMADFLHSIINNY